jgi:quinohemoprotein amine dehydrogenase
MTVHGFGLSGEVALGDGVKILETVSSDANTVTVVAEASADATAGARTISVGETSASGLLSVYTQIDSVRVDPPFAISRVGGGTTPAVIAQFTAVAYLNGPDGQAGTGDDVSAGSVPAQWSVENFDEEAEAMEDTKYVGAIDQNGAFHPAGAGPNPERKYRTNNVGRIAVKAVVDDAGREVEGSAEMVVTVQRWNTPPIL